MAYDLETVRWEDEAGNFHDGRPSSLSDTYGMLIHAVDTETGEHDYFWAFVYDTFESWEEWLYYVYALIEGGTGLGGGGQAIEA